MKKIVLLLILAATFSCAQEKNEKQADDTSVYYFIRHAEKDRSDPENKNPDLTDVGNKRAEKWAEVLKNVSLDAVYSTNYNRTLQTATPAAKQDNVEIILYDPRGLDMNAFKADTKGKTVLVVGHSNTTPMLVNEMLGEKKYASINDNNNANLYIVTITSYGITDILLKID